MRHLAVPELHGPRAGRHAVESLRHAGRLADHVEQHLGVDALEQRPRVVLLVLLVGGVRLRRKLIDARSRDGANQLLASRTCCRRGAWPGRRAIRDWSADWWRGRRRPARPCRGPGSGPRCGWRGCGRTTGCPGRSASRRGRRGDRPSDRRPAWRCPGRAAVMRARRCAGAWSVGSPAATRHLAAPACRARLSGVKNACMP